MTTLSGLARVLEQALVWSRSVNAPTGADGYALPAVGALTVRHHLVEGGGNGGVESAADGTQRAYGLHVVADTLAAAAEDTFVHVADDGRSHLPLAG